MLKFIAYFTTTAKQVFVMALGGQLVDVTTKATIVQRSTLEDEQGKGKVHALCQARR